MSENSGNLNLINVGDALQLAVRVVEDMRDIKKIHRMDLDLLAGRVKYRENKIEAMEEHEL